MPALSGGNTTLWRTFPQKMELRAYVDIPSVVLSGLVNQASFTYPLQNFTYDGGVGAYADVEDGYTIRVYNNARTRLKGIQRVRGATSTLITIAPTGPGLIYFEDNDAFDIVLERRLWIEVPQIQPDGTIFKDWGVSFTAGTAQPPVANAGPDVAGDVNSGTGLLTVTFDGTGSYPIADDATISTYLWDVGDGTITVGTSASSAITATFPVGRRYISLTVTDSNGNPHTAYALVAAIDGSTLSSHKVSNIRLGGRVESGWEASFQLHGAGLSNIPDGAKVILYSKEKYGSTSQGLNGYSGRENVKFVGWKVRRLVKIKPLTGTDMTINAQNTLAFMAFSQVTERASSPANWFQVANLSWWRHIHYLLHWHSNWLDLCDFERPSFYASYPAMRIDAESGTLDSQLEFLCKSVRARFTCDYQGRCYFRYNPHFLNTVEFSNWTSIVAITKADWTADGIDLEYDEQESTGVVWGGGVVASATEIVAVEAAAPGALPSGIGAGEDSLNNQLLENKADLLQRVQRQYEFRNRKLKKIRAPMKSHGMVADPAWQEAIPITISSSDNSAGVSMTAEKTVLVAVDVNFNERDGYASEVWTLEPTSQDRIAIGLIINQPGATPDEAYDYVPDDGTWEEQTPYDWSNVAPVEYVPDVVEEPPASTESVEVVTLGAVSGSKLHYTSDWTAGSGSPTWTQRAAPTTAIQQLLPALNSRQAIYALMIGALWHSANVATTNLADLGLGVFGMDAWLMRMTAAGHLVIFGDDGTDTAVRVYNLSTLSSIVTIDTYQGEANGDVDDFGLGLVVVPSNFQLWFATSYTGTFTQMSGLTGVTGSSPAHITMARIPYRRVSGALNSNLAAMEVIYSIYRSSLHRVTYNFLTNSVVSSTDITPTIGGNPAGCLSAPDNATTVVSSGRNFEVYAGDANRMIGSFRSSTAVSAVLASDDGGNTWSDWGTASNVAHQVHFVEPERGGDGLKCWGITVLDIYRTDDFWGTHETIQDAGYTGGTAHRGIFQL